MGGSAMQFFYWLVLLIAIGIAIFVVQNSYAPLVMMKFLIWRFETSLIYNLLGSVGVRILITLFFCIPRAIRSSIQMRELKRQIENLETVLYKPADLAQEGIKSREG